MKIWNVLLIVAGCFNTVNAVASWSYGWSPDWFIWMSSILFSIGIVLDGLHGLYGLKS